MNELALFELTKAQHLDAEDPVPSRRDEFHIPPNGSQDSLYFTGNSLGLQPRSAQEALKTELDDWAKHGVEGHFRAQHPWVNYHERFAEGLKHLVGAQSNRGFSALWYPKDRCSRPRSLRRIGLPT